MSDIFFDYVVYGQPLTYGEGCVLGGGGGVPLPTLKKGEKTLLYKKTIEKDTSVFTFEKKVTSVHQKTLLSTKSHFCLLKVTSVYTV